MPASLLESESSPDGRGSAPIQMADGVVYSGVGGGIVGSGSNLRAIRWADITLHMAEELKKAASGLESQLTTEIARMTGSVPVPARLRLVELGEEKLATYVCSI